MPTPVTVLGELSMSGEGQARRRDQTGKRPRAVRRQAPISAAPSSFIRVNAEIYGKLG
jgi:hypothetical protein